MSRYFCENAQIGRALLGKVPYVEGAISQVASRGQPLGKRAAVANASEMCLNVGFRIRRDEEWSGGASP